MIRPKKRGVKQLAEILNVLKQARPLFLPIQKIEQQKNVQFNEVQISKYKKLDLDSMDRQQRDLEIIKRFINEFQTQSLQISVSIRNYVLFLVTVLKIARKLKPGHGQSLILAHTLSRLNQMFVNHPIEYSTRAIRDPLLLLFLVTEFALEAGSGLEHPYKFDEITMSQFVILVTRFCQDSENPLQTITKAIVDMPKFRLPITIGEGHQRIIGKIMQHCICKMPLKKRIETASKLLNKITLEKIDSNVLTHYNTLKLLLEEDGELRAIVSKIVKNEIIKTGHRRFVNSVLEELAGLGKVV